MSGSIVMLGPVMSGVKVGDRVKVVNRDGIMQYMGVVRRVSPQGKRVSIDQETPKDETRQVHMAFYRDDREPTDKRTVTYIYEPGVGQWGHMLNDRFTVSR